MRVRCRVCCCWEGSEREEERESGKEHEVEEEGSRANVCRAAAAAAASAANTRVKSCHWHYPEPNVRTPHCDQTDNLFFVYWNFCWPAWSQESETFKARARVSSSSPPCRGKLLKFFSGVKRRQQVFSRRRSSPETRATNVGRPNIQVLSSSLSHVGPVDSVKWSRRECSFK